MNKLPSFFPCCFVLGGLFDMFRLAEAGTFVWHSGSGNRGLGRVPGAETRRRAAPSPTRRRRGRGLLSRLESAVGPPEPTPSRVALVSRTRACRAARHLFSLSGGDMDLDCGELTGAHERSG